MFAAFVTCTKFFFSLFATKFAVTFDKGVAGGRW